MTCRLHFGHDERRRHASRHRGLDSDAAICLVAILFLFASKECIRAMHTWARRHVLANALAQQPGPKGHPSHFIMSHTHHIELENQHQPYWGNLENHQCRRKGRPKYVQILGDAPERRTPVNVHCKYTLPLWEAWYWCHCTWATMYQWRCIASSGQCPLTNNLFSLQVDHSLIHKS